MRFAKAFVGWTDHREKRRDKRRSSPIIEILLDGEAYRTMNWSLGGVLLTEYYGARAPGDEVEGQIQVLTDMNMHAFRAVVIRRNSTSGELALNFTELSNDAFSLLEGVMLGSRGI